jgi:tetratricopeptide (TPR) repeat protein
MNSNIQIGIDLISKGELEGALKQFDLMVEANPIDHLAIYYVGLCHLKMDKVSTSIIHFDRALELAPNTVNYLSDRAVAKLRAKDKNGTLADLDRCVELEPNYSYRYSLRGFARNSFGDAEGAIADYKKAIELDPEDPITLNNLGLVEEAQGYKTEAQRNFEAADKLSGYDSKKRAENHTIQLNTANRPGKNHSEASDEQGYWGTIKKVFTDADQRSEFFKFTSDLLRGKKH